MKKVFVAGPLNLIYLVADENGFGRNKHGRKIYPDMFRRLGDAREFVSGARKFTTARLFIYKQNFANSL